MNDFFRNILLAGAYTAAYFYPWLIYIYVGILLIIVVRYWKHVKLLDISSDGVSILNLSLDKNGTGSYALLDLYRDSWYKNDPDRLIKIEILFIVFYHSQWGEEPIKVDDNDMTFW